MADPDFDALEVWADGHIGWLVLDRPEVGNAMDATMMGELEEAWAWLDAAPDVRVVVQTGNGPDFCTGLDVAQLSRDPDALREQSRRTRRFELRLTGWHCGVWKPVVAAVNGRCAGGGLHFVADADIVVLADDAQLFDPHVSVGQASVYETITLARTSPMETILRMALTGAHERLGAERARQLGICSEVVSAAELRPAAAAVAGMVARNSPAAMAATKRALWGALEAGLSDACRIGGRQLVSMWGHVDQTEGPLAFTERRDAAWQTLESS